MLCLVLAQGSLEGADKYQGPVTEAKTWVWEKFREAMKKDFLLVR